MRTGDNPRWVIDGNNVFGSRPDGWWNDRAGAAFRFTQCVAEWCRTHDDEVVIVFDAPVLAETMALTGGNLMVVEATRRGRDAADDEIVTILDRLDPAQLEVTIVVTSDRGLRSRLPSIVEVSGSGRFRRLIGY
ncbi:MAG: NYN domain-containing protein [Actinomycetia bacterium]|nr:NYN domain-containing protein [Actinomycetes bacterium]MCP4222482.1 NYN domain-containing protein [Actinomycetes bacterium]MCP5030534.1 NYN domain-containing protein [Actinomycetes bacterium]